MINFVHVLPNNSQHLSNIELGDNHQTKFNLSLGQRCCLRTIIQKIDEIISNMPNQVTQSQSSASSSSSSASYSGSFSVPLMPSSSARQSFPDPVFDLANLQSIVDKKLSQALKIRGYSVDHFPIVASQTASYPYRVTILCPNCDERVHIPITADLKKTHKVVNFRRYKLIEHLLKCTAEEKDDDEDDENGYFND